MNKIPGKIIWIVALIMAGVFLIVGFFLLNGRKSSIRTELKALHEETQAMNQDFSEEYQSDETFPEYSKAVHKKREIDKEGFTSLEEIRSNLKELPDDFAGITQRDDVFAITYGSARVGQQLWENFLSDLRFELPSQIILAQFTANEDPIYYFIEYNGDYYHIVVDSTRDGYDEENGYTEGFWDYLKVEGYEQNDGSITEYAFLCDDDSLTYQMVQDYYGGKKVSGMEAPDIWDFYIRNIPQQEFDERRQQIDSNDLDAVKTYTGYADIHPVYASGNEYKDYDKDGILDRIYRKYTLDEDGEDIVKVYCFFGNGTTLELDSDLWGDTFSTYCMDFNGNQTRDICFIQSKDEEDGSESRATIYEAVSDTFRLLPFSKDVYLDVSTDDFDQELEQYCASTIEVFQDRDGTNALRCGWTFADDDSQQHSIRCTLFYRDGKWQIRDRVEA